MDKNLRSIHLPAFHFDENLREVPDNVDDWRDFVALLENSLSKLPQPENELQIIESLAVAHRILLNLDSAELLLSKALAESHGRPPRLLQNSIRLAHVYQWKRDFKSSKALFLNAKKIIDGNSIPEALIAAYHQHLGKYYFDQEQYKEARSEFGIALGIRLRASSADEQIASSRLSLITAIKRSGDVLTHLVVKSDEQVAELWKGAAFIKSYKVSTALNGLSAVEGSYGTPPGKLRVAAKFGDNLPLGSVLRGRVPTGEIWSDDLSNPLALSSDDLVLTRLLWLEGEEETNKNTLQRFVYLHGTNQEKLLGQAVSHGCIRFSNEDILEIYSSLEVYSQVKIC